MHESHPGLMSPLAAPGVHPVRQLAALALRHASRLLVRLARRLARHRSGMRRLRPPELEFYAEAGAPEGALYLDGELVGHLPGVTRL